MNRTLSVLALSLVGCANGNSPSNDASVPPGPDQSTPDQSAIADGGTTPTDAFVPPPTFDFAGVDLAWNPGAEFQFLSGGDGLGAPVIDATPDEAHNIWAVAPDALYIRRAGETMFRRYTNSDGLHIYTTISAVAGAGPNEGYVGLNGFESDYPDQDTYAEEIVGKAEHVHLLPDGSISSLHYWNIHNDNSANYWHTRSARRLLYGHTGVNTGHLYMGGNHGITDIFNDGWGDHVHVEVIWPDGSEALGEWYGLAFDPATDGIWTCGHYGCGLQNFRPDPPDWVINGHYKYAFTVFTGDHSLNTPAHYEERFVATTVTPDGRAWFLSSLFGLAVWDPKTGNYETMSNVKVPGLGTPHDMVADPDGTLWITDGVQVLRFNPQSGSAPAFALPSNEIHRLYMDNWSQPRTLYISTGAGLAIYHGQ